MVAGVMAVCVCARARVCVCVGGGLVVVVGGTGRGNDVSRCCNFVIVFL